MRVLVLSQYFWPESFRINELVTALNAKGVKVEVLTGKPNYPAGTVFAGYRAWGCTRESFQGVPLHRVPLMPRGSGALRLALNYLSFILSGIVFAPWLLRGRHFDAIFVFAPSPILQAIPAIWLGWLKKCPVLLWVQDLWPESLSATGNVTHPGALNAVEHVVRWIYRKVDLLLVQSRAFMPRVQELAADTPVVYYPNSFVVLEAGTLLGDESDIRFVMVGDGSWCDWMQQQAAARGLGNLVFLGNFPIEAMSVLRGRAAAQVRAGKGRCRAGVRHPDAPYPVRSSAGSHGRTWAQILQRAFLSRETGGRTDRPA